MTVENRPWLVPFLTKMRVRPGAYLGAETVRHLDLYISAYCDARQDLGLPEFGPGEEHLLADFAQWLEASSGVRDTRGWWGIVERVDPSDTNVHKFIQLFDAFLRAETKFEAGLAGPGQG